MDELGGKLRQAKALAGRGKVSRRDFMQLAMATGLSAAAASTLFATSARAEPKKGGSFRIGIYHGATTDSLDPATHSGGMVATALWGGGSNSLTEVDAKGAIHGDIAESFEPSEGARKWMFKIRPGVTFHDGKSVTAKDVIASIRHHMGPDTKSGAKSILTSVEDIREDDVSTVVFDLSEGNADFPFLLSDYHLAILQANEDGTANWQTPVRTGPFTIERFEPGVRALLKRNPNYHRDVWFDDVTVTVIADVTARTNALLTGAVDYIDRCELKTLNLLERNSNIEVDKVTGYGHHMFIANVTEAPFDNRDVRTALKYAVDREDIVRKVFGGVYSTANDNPVAPTLQYAIDPQPVHKYDPELARSYIKKAGLDTLSIDLSVSDAAFAGAVDAALLFKEHARAAGIEINVIREAADSYWDNVWMKKPFSATSLNGRATADWLFTTSYAENAAWNETAWKNPRFNELLVQARAELDQTKRAAMYAEMQQLVHDDGGLINLVWSTYVSAHSKNVAHGEIAANWENDGRKIPARWWTA